ncbi:related to SEC3 - component of exocyst complex [Cephalotrichum gorgonifer]|uniref:Related to SEC3 - component of exocyst complex n=1 Tax=Cephalotrichum gorgonifer TaxID=2041049 RepID=A0AAE8N218_9PEZI|nr:related to SEC3 - component of exocyst complex [Cephalotrichum gorgonifer]
MDRNGNGAALASKSRADLFEDEKRRIIDSCFSKRDPDGSLQETYITHIRITEYSAYPSTPPPPGAQLAGSEKPRIIIVAVRKSGRVRMHKTKENANGTFSIGKTWNLDDLTHIQSYSSPSVDPILKQSAGDTGFQVTIQKAYFWNAQSEKEKKFFIASLVKIYGKYTNGKSPELTGFDQRELDQILGRRPPPVRPGTNENINQRSVSGASSTGGPGPNIPLQAPLHPVPASSPNRPGYPTTTSSSPAGSFDSGRSQNPAGLRRLASPDKSSLDSTSSSLKPSRGDDASSLPPRSRGGITGAGAFGRFGEPSPEPAAPSALSDRPPERKRPPIEPMRPPQPFADRDLVPAPLMSPGMKKDPVPPPPRNVDRMTPRNNSMSQRSDAGSLRDRSASQNEPSLRTKGSSTSLRSAGQGSFSRSSPSIEPPLPRQKTPVPADTEDSRPGLGPMIKQKRLSPEIPMRGPLNTPPIDVQEAEEDTRPGLGPMIRQRKPALEAPTDSQADQDDTRPGLGPMIRTKKSFSSLSDTVPTPAQEQPTESTPGLGSAVRGKKSLADMVSLVTSAEQGANRPGLGPMIKTTKSKGDLAGSLWKAAAAAGAFKPRPGGAGERLRMAREKAENEGPDGITDVVPAPPRPTSSSKATVAAASEGPTPEDRNGSVPEVKVTVPQTSRPNSLSVQTGDNKTAPAPATAQNDQSRQEDERRAASAGNDLKYLATLGIDPAHAAAFLDNPKSIQLREWMDLSGFVPGEQMRACTWDQLKSGLDREVDKAQAGGWLSRFREDDERIDGIKEGIDRVVLECEQLDDLLTLYSAGLGTIAADIDYLEAQAEGIQVQVANQKALQKELLMLTDTCDLNSDWNIDALRSAPLDKGTYLADVEDTLLQLFKTMRKIDPSLCGSDTKDKGIGMGSDLAHLGDDIELAMALGLGPDTGSGLTSSYGRMRIVQEKRDVCLQESNIFINRFTRHMESEFDTAFASTRNMLDRALSRKSDKEIYQTHRRHLWKYTGLILYTRDIHQESWEGVLQAYHERGNPLFKSTFGSILESWKSNAGKSGFDESELLFTHPPEKQHDNLATAARKLTVKRSQNLAGRLRSETVTKSVADKSSMDGRGFSFEVVRGALDDIVPLVEMEQNFIIDYFHATTLEQMSFEDYLAAQPATRDRKAPDYEWLGFRRMEPDRDMARKVTRTMEGIFSFLELDLQRLMEWVMAKNPLHGIGVLASLEAKMESLSGSNQEFLNSLLQKMRSSLEVRFRKFVDEQVRAIEETKVKIVKKRRGVIHFFRVFPPFSTAVEAILSSFQPGAVDVRHMVNEEYGRILTAMFDALKVIARESKGVGVSSSSTDPEDKEALNYHILLIENLSYFIEEMGDPGVDVLEDRKHEAIQEYNKHLEQYLSAIMRRPLGKLLDYIENVEAQIQALKSPSQIASQPSNSKAVFNKVLSAYDAKEVRKGIEALRKRVEKHFGDADEPGMGGAKELVDKVTEECEKFYGKVELRIATITAEVYGGDVLFEWPRIEVKSAFAAR